MSKNIQIFSSPVLEFPRGALIAVCLLLAPWLAAQDILPQNFSAPAEIEKRLAAARAEIEAPPADADPALHERLQLLEFACQHHLAAINIASQAKAACDESAAAATSWRGFAQPPPYPITLRDEIHETLAGLEKALKAAETQYRIFTSAIEASRDKLNEHQSAERRFLYATGTGTSEERLVAQGKLQAEQVFSRIAAEEVARLYLRLEAEQAEVDMIQSKIQLAKAQLAAIAGRVVFSQAHLDAILKRISDERTEALGLVEATFPTTIQSNPLLPWKVEFLDLEKAFWESRFASFHTKDPAVRKQSLSTLDDLMKRVDDWELIARIRLEGGTTAAEEIDPDQLRNSLQEVEAMERLIASTIADLQGGKRGTPVLDHIASATLAFWNMELYLVEESEIIDGKKIPTYRAVTIGKLLRLALILTVGWLILRFLSRRLNKLLSRSSKLTESATGIIGKATFISGLVILLLYGMNKVHIPLTVFAFLGGAFAIGIGFGTQTLLKNFISGIILIFERPLKVGDVVEVSTITGTIQKIGMRASVIRHFDGIETLVPNSLLLENQLTNWTFSNSVIRHFITIGAAYGSPTREVAEILLTVAKSHGLVRKEPGPQVRLDDFGPDSLNFTLLFWLDTAKIGRADLASDLRFMIDKAFGEAGIVIAFPQRDIHFDPEIPLRVEVSHTPKSES